VVVVLPPAARVLEVLVPIAETVPPPFAAVETWKRFVKDAPVEAEPAFVIVPENVSAVPTVAVVGVVVEAVRSGVGHAEGAVPGTAEEYAEFPEAFSALTV
jgi:hypothetical protein